MEHVVAYLLNCLFIQYLCSISKYWSSYILQSFCITVILFRKLEELVCQSGSFFYSVRLITYLWRRPTLGQAQLKMILHGSEEILETFSCTIQEVLKERLLEKIRERACVKHLSADYSLFNLLFFPCGH